MLFSYYIVNDLVKKIDYLIILCEAMIYIWMIVGNYLDVCSRTYISHISSMCYIIYAGLGLLGLGSRETFIAAQNKSTIGTYANV